MNELYYDQVLIGDSLAALAIAYYEGIPIIVTEQEFAPYYHKIGEKTKEYIWQELAMRLSLAGLMPFSDKVGRIQMKEDSVEVYGIRPYMVTVYSDNIRDIREEKNARFKEKDSVYEVVDWFFARGCQPHEHDVLYSDDDFVKEIKFFPSKRGVGNKNKDLIAISYMTKEQLEDPDYSETYVFLKTRNMMKEAGIRGPKNGIDNGIQKYLSLKIEHEERQIFPVNDFDDITLNKLKGKKPTNKELIKFEGLFGELEI